MNAKAHFANANIVGDPGLCFVLMPFAQAEADRWETIRSTISDPPFNLVCRRADDIAKPGHVMTAVLDNIGRARLVIADLTKQSPNVFYELGIAHSVKDDEQVVLIASSVEEIPFDLRHMRTIIYADDRDLRDRLAEVVRELGLRQYHLDLSDGETGRVPARLTGDEFYLYDVDVTLDYLGEGGVEFTLSCTRLAAGENPEPLPATRHYLGDERPSMTLPEMPWALCYSRPESGRVRFVVGRPPGWLAEKGRQELLEARSIDEPRMEGGRGVPG
jgi:hypothetical protein